MSQAKTELFHAENKIDEVRGQISSVRTRHKQLLDLEEKETTKLDRLRAGIDAESLKKRLAERELQSLDGARGEDGATVIRIQRDLC